MQVGIQTMRVLISYCLLYAVCTLLIGGQCPDNAGKNV